MNETILALVSSGNRDKAPNEPTNPWEDFGKEIVIQAVKDWIFLIKRKAWKNGGYINDQHGGAKVTFTELRQFFKSNWCEFLLNGSDIRKEFILAQLEDMLESAKYGISVKTWRKNINRR